MDESELRKYFVCAPGLFNFKFRKNARRDLRRVLFRAASANGRYIKSFFPYLADTDMVHTSAAESNNKMDVDDDEDEVMDEDSDEDMGRPQGQPQPMDWIINSENTAKGKVDPSHPGRPCVKKFMPGEPTYRCLTCGLDNTCVMCQYCYDESHHEGHQVTITISQHDTGGVCDCGDPEAWSKQFHCKYHSLENYTNDPLPDELHSALKATIKTALDFAIDVFAPAHTGIQRFQTAEAVKSNDARSRLSERVYGVVDDCTNDKYTLQMWNDNKHSFMDAVSCIRHGTKKTRAFAEMVTKHIDGVGRGTVYVSEDLDKLLDMKKSMERTSLVNTIRASRDIYREEMCGVIFEWLDDISKAPVDGNYLAVRDMISEALCEPWNYGLECLRDGWEHDAFAEAELTHAKQMDKHTMLNGPYIPDPMSFVEQQQDQMELDETDDILNDDFDDDDDDEQGGGGAFEDITEGARRDAVAAAVAAMNNTRNNNPATDANNEDEGEEEENNGEGLPGTEDAASRLLNLITENTGVTSLAELFGYRMPQEQNNARRHKRQRIDRANPPPSFWTSESSANKGKHPQLSARVQYLIFFDIRLWKQLRLLLRDLYVSILVSNPEYKTKLAVLYADLYPQLSELYILADREPDCSIISSLSTQLFTTPSIASVLVQNDYVARILAAIYTFLTISQIAPPQAIVSNLPLSDDSRLLRNRRFSQLFHDLDFILNRNKDKHFVHNNQDRIAQITDLMVLFQGQLPMERQKTKHIEYEPEAWVVLFNIMPLVHQLGINVALGIEDSDAATRCLQVILPMLGRWVFDMYGKKTNRTEVKEPPQFRPIVCEVPNMTAVNELETIRGSIVKCKVDSALVSLHHPVHAFVSRVIENGKFANAQSLREALLPYCEVNDRLSTDQALMTLFDHPLRVIALMSQIQVGMWIRNGMSIRSQMLHYRDLTLRDFAYRRDLFMVQTSLVTLDPALAFMAIRDRWDIGAKLISEVDQEDANMDVIKQLYMIEEFLHFLIGVLMERHQLMNLSEDGLKEKYITKEIIQCLCFGDHTYSEICRYIPDQLHSDAMFEDVLQKVANYRPPRGVNDYGKYSIKPELMERFDTHYIHFSSTRIEEAETVYTEHYQKLHNDKDRAVVNEPPVETITSGAFVNLSAFTRTIPFAVMVHDVLKMLLDDDGENHHDNILNNLLHLLHIAALDGFNRQQDGATLFANVMSRELFNFEQETCSVVKLLCYFVKNDIVKKQACAKVMRIFSLLREQDSTMAEYLTANLGDNRIGEIPQVETEAERRKRIGMEKRKLAMAQMQQMQQSFVANNDLDEGADDEEEGHEEGGTKFLEEECILCQMKDKDTVFGAVGYFMNTNVQRDVPFDDKRWVYEAYGGSPELDQACSRSDVKQMGGEAWQEYQREIEKCKIGPGFPADCSNRKPLFVTCGHVLHYKCFEEYVVATRSRGNQLTRNFPEDSGRGEFLCPLCHSICNVFMPCMWKRNERKFDEFMTQTTSFDEFILRVNSLDEQGFFDQAEFDKLDLEMVKKYGLESMGPAFKHAVKLTNMHQTSVSDDNLDQAQLIAKTLDKSLDKLVTRICNVSDEVQQQQQQLSNANTMHIATVVGALANTISATEIELRGAQYENQYCSGLVVGQLKGRKLESVQMFAELCRSVLAIITSLKTQERSDYLTEDWKNCDLNAIKLCKDGLPNLFKFDANNPFADLVQQVMISAPGASNSLDAIHFTKAYYMKAVMQFITKFADEVVDRKPWTTDPTWLELPPVETLSETGVAALSNLINQVKLAAYGESTALDEMGPQAAQAAYTMLTKQITPFLRKSAIFLHILCGYGYNHEEWEEAFEPEVEKLCTFLKLPTLETLLTQMQTGGSEGELAKCWIGSFVDTQPELKLEYPGIERLLKLPKRLDECFDLNNHALDDEIKRLPPDPAICLFCGQTVGLQNVEYSGDPRGECYRHMLKCAQDFGIFLLPKRSSLLLLRNNQGSFAESPYLDLHGEADETLRRGRPQFLQENRYDHFTRSVWLQHDVPSFIARKLESGPDFGGWETL